MITLKQTRKIVGSFRMLSVHSKIKEIGPGDRTGGRIWNRGLVVPSRRESHANDPDFTRDIPTAWWAEPVVRIPIKNVHGGRI
jgi:hypothetical protein